jgi:rfaE bifunctional protein nucleotidyltransferase chain/domain
MNVINPSRWGYEDKIVESGGTTARRIMVKEQYRTPCWQVPLDTTVVVTHGAVWLSHGNAVEAPAKPVLSGMWIQENDRIHLEKGTLYQLTGVRDSVVHEYSYGYHIRGEELVLNQVMPGEHIEEDEFRDILLSYIRTTTESGGVIDISEAGEIAESLASDGRLIGMCNGCFDLIHPGHAELLLQAKQRCEVLFVGLNTDSSVRRAKGDGRPFIEEEGRAIMLSSMRFVDHVVMNDSLTCVEVVKAIKPDVYITTPDCSECAEAKATLAIGGRVEVIDPFHGWSTTKISNEILEAHSPR